MEAWRREPRCAKTKIRRPKYLGFRNNCCTIMMTTESVYKTVKHNDDLEGTANVAHACFIPAVELPRVMMAHPGSHGSNHILGFVSRNDQKCFGGSAAVCLLHSGCVTNPTCIKPRYLLLPSSRDKDCRLSNESKVCVSVSVRQPSDSQEYFVDFDCSHRLQCK